MIKIETPAINQIAQRYFNNIKVKIKERISFFDTVFNVLFGTGTVDSIGRHSLHGNAKKPLVNFLLAPAFKIENQNQYDRVQQANLRPWVINNYQIIRDILTFLDDDKNLRDIVLALPGDTYEVDSSLQAHFVISKATHKEIFDFINTIINYGFHSEFAYDIAAELGINTCPYCNRTFINTVFDERKNKVIRATFDHFFSQADHPFLSLSFYNLIPSCHWCNENLKLATPMGLETHIHPFIEGYENDCKFRILISGMYTQKSDPRNYTVVLQENIDRRSAKYRRIFGTSPGEGNNSLFKIREIYNCHTDIVGELVVKADRYSISHSDSLFKLFGLLNTNKSEFYQFYFGNYFHTHNHHKRPFAKFTRDIVEQVLPDFFI